MKLILCLLIVVSFFDLSFAHAKKKRRKRKKSQVAVVQVDGAAVYKVPNFDSPIVSYLNKGKKIRASKKLYPGIGGLGSFYKVRIKKGKYGYVTDVDLFPVKTKAKKEESAAIDSEVFSGSSPGEEKPFVSEESGAGLYLSRWVGLSYNMVNFSEEISGKTFSENRGFMGLKLSGPKALFTSLPLELNLMASFSPASYYADISEGAEGFTLLADLLYVLPFIEETKYMIYYGLGPMVSYNSLRIKVTRNGVSEPVELDSQVVNLGLSGALGLAYKLGQSFMVKLEAKYLYEKQGHLSLGGGLQMKF